MRKSVHFIMNVMNALFEEHKGKRRKEMKERRVEKNLIFSRARGKNVIFR